MIDPTILDGIIGGLKQGVTTLDMAHAYETFATGGLRVYAPGLAAPREGPVGIAQIQCLTIKCHGKSELFATPHYRRVIPAVTAAFEKRAPRFTD